MRLGAVLIAAVLLTSGTSVPARSQQPPTADSQKATAQKQPGTKDFPAFVKIIQAEKSKAELDREDAEHNEKTATDTALVSLTGDLAFYTKALAVGTFLLFLATGALVRVGYLQIRDARSSISAAVVAAKAAQDQVALGRDEFNASHRPKIRVRSVGRSRDNANRLGFSVVNIGDTNCSIVGISFQVKKASGEIPDTAGDADLINGSGEEIKPGGFEGYQTPEVKIPPFQHWDFCGVVQYVDSSEVHRITGFWSRFNPDTERWMRPEDQDFNYEY